MRIGKREAPARIDRVENERTIVRTRGQISRVGERLDPDYSTTRGVPYWRSAAASDTLRAGIPESRAMVVPRRIEEASMATENKRGSREAKKPKKPVVKTIAAAASTKDMVSAAVKNAKK
jgi:hypothetical protein